MLVVLKHELGLSARGIVIRLHHEYPSIIFLGCPILFFSVNHVFSLCLFILRLVIRALVKILLCPIIGIKAFDRYDLACRIVILHHSKKCLSLVLKVTTGSIWPFKAHNSNRRHRKAMVRRLWSRRFLLFLRRKNTFWLCPRSLLLFYFFHFTVIFNQFKYLYIIGKPNFIMLHVDTEMILDPLKMQWNVKTQNMRKNQSRISSISCSVCCGLSADRF